MFADIYASVYKIALTLTHYHLIRNLKALNVNIVALFKLASLRIWRCHATCQQIAVCTGNVLNLHELWQYDISMKNMDFSNRRKLKVSL